MKNKTDKDKTTMTAREVAVLIEDLRSQFRAFGDELKTINRRIEGIETTLAKAWEKLTEIDLRLIRVEKKVEEIEKDIVVMKEDIRIIKEDFKVFDKRLTAVETPK